MGLTPHARLGLLYEVTMRWLLLLLALMGLAASLPESEPSVERLLRDGGIAYDQGDYAGALRLFDEAEPFAADPGRVTLALAAAHFRLALQGGDEAGRHLADAIGLFRCLLAPTEPRQPQALVGLGSCLLVRARLARQHAAAEEALAVLEDCLKAQPEEKLGHAARRLLHRARLLEWQLLPGPMEQQQSDPPPGEPEKESGPKEKKPETRPGEKDPDGMKKAGSTKPTPVDDPNGQAKEEKGGPPGSRPGEGSPPVVSDRDPLPPALNPAEAVHRLRAATRLIQAEQKAFRKSLARPAAEGVPDW